MPWQTDMLASELKEICKHKQVKAQGTKKTMIGRLRAFVKSFF